MQGIVVLDAGGQYCHLLARRVREIGVQSHVLPIDTPAAKLTGISGIIISGGPRSVTEAGSPRIDPSILAMGVPILGICYGHQLLAATLPFVVMMYIAGARPTLSVVIVGYLGMILLGGLFISVGIFASACTRHQLLSAIIAITMPRPMNANATNVKAMKSCMGCAGSGMPIAIASATQTCSATSVSPALWR